MKKIKYIQLSKMLFLYKVKLLLVIIKYMCQTMKNVTTILGLLP